MTWYYAKEGAPAGPISDEELLSKLRIGTVLPTTLVWKTGMTDWQAASSITDKIAPPTFESASNSNRDGMAPGAGASDTGAPPVLPFFFCTCCATIIPADQLVRIDGRAICANCKPGYLQKVQEGVIAPLKVPVLHALETSLAAQIPAATAYAGFWIRALAFLLDGVILWAVNIGTHLLAGESIMGAASLDNSDWDTRSSVLFGTDFLVGIVYEVVLVTKYGGTLGKLVCRICVVTAGGARLGYGRSLLRSLARLVSALPCAIGFVIAAFDSQKRALHDFMCNTRVIPAKQL